MTAPKPIQQPRDHAVPCRRCMQATWNANAVCNDCQKK